MASTSQNHSHILFLLLLYYFIQDDKADGAFPASLLLNDAHVLPMPLLGSVLLHLHFIRKQLKRIQVRLYVWAV